MQTSAIYVCIIAELTYFALKMQTFTFSAAKQ